MDLFIIPQKVNKMEKKNEYDFTVDGKCSGCGRCCQAILTISEKEIQKIKSYIGQKKIKPINRHNIGSTEFVDVCPFLNEENRCNIYPVRPEVCKRFLCSQYRSVDAPYFNHMDKHIVNLYDVFLPDVKYPASETNVLKENFKYEERKKQLASNLIKKW